MAAHNDAHPVLKQRHPNNNHPSDTSPTTGLRGIEDDALSHTDEKKPLLSKKSLSTTQEPGAAPAWLCYIGFLALLFGVAFQAHYTLPAPVSELYNPTTGQAQFAESNVRRIVKHLSKDIGYRIVGTEQDQETQTYLLSEIKALEEQAEVQALRGADGLPKFETWVQVADGSHQFDFMSKGNWRGTFDPVYPSTSSTVSSSLLFVSICPHVLPPPSHHPRLFTFLPFISSLVFCPCVELC